MIKIVIAALISICLISVACGVEYSANIIAEDTKFVVEIDCPLEAQEKSEFMVNATITNPAQENATDVIAELVAEKQVFSYGQPKKQIRTIEGLTQTTVTWNVKAKRPGTYNITVVATGKTETTGEDLFAQDQEAIVVNPGEPHGLKDIINFIRAFFNV